MLSETAQKEKTNAYWRQYRAANKERINARARERAALNPHRNRNTHLIRKYGLTIEQYDAMLEAQQGCCAICKATEPGGRKKDNRGRFYVDHCHVTGAVRGLLCHHCNSGLGHFKDNDQNLIAAASYLRRAS